LAWLIAEHGTSLSFIHGDVRDYETLSRSVIGMDRAYHLASQVAVTTSVRDPRTDFEVNALGTLNLLEALRTNAPHAAIFYASTNKVYGCMEGIVVDEGTTRYRLADLPWGIPESMPLDFHSPYGCSKGSGDQYVRDYARIYGLKTVVFRQSCIYGSRQFGIEDQGWLVHFCISAALGRPITIFGNGKQVRDILWVDDLIRAYELAADRIDIATGKVYNIGGGPENIISIWADFGPLLEELVGHPVPARFKDRRPGDQPVYISDIRRAKRELDWSPIVGVHQGIRKLWDWVNDNLALFNT
jgi:CDP-paratose 2-epimerase